MKEGGGGGETDEEQRRSSLCHDKRAINASTEGQFVSQPTPVTWKKPGQLLGKGAGQTHEEGRKTQRGKQTGSRGKKRRNKGAQDAKTRG